MRRFLNASVAGVLSAGPWIVLILACWTASAAEGAESVTIPRSRPPGGSFSRPLAGQRLDVSPPGFSWWRAAARGKVQYRLNVADESGGLVYQSPRLIDPVHVPSRTLPGGRYTWTVDALDTEGNVLDTQPSRSFVIAEGAYGQAWVAPEDLLSRVPAEHPRLLFPKARLDEIRATLKTSRREAFESLRGRAERGLELKPPPEPDYDEIADRSERRLAYLASFSRMRRYHTDGMLHMALMYALTGEKKYGESARAILLGATEWDPEGISSVMAPHGDEVGLGLVKSEALTYDWIHDLLTDEERGRVKKMLIARADQMLRRLERRDFLCRPESSHDGRLPGYLLEHAIALAEEPRSEVWMDYALKTILTVFPHWAGEDGGWAEGLAYGSAYNTIFITPLESLRIATGMDVWQRPFYRKLPYFFMYMTSPVGEVFGFGDSYNSPVSGRAGSLRGLLQFHAEHYRDPTIRWWVDLLRTRDDRPGSLPALPGLILPTSIEPEQPLDVPPDAVFRGVGWAALHSDIARPENDLFVMFKSSPFGPVSHSYADQNSFSILQGGTALARAGGSRYPQHGTPFHTKYTQQTIAQNAILVNGQGQINRDASANGRIVDFQSRDHFGYVAGDASAAYGKRLSRCVRHVLLVRPSLVLVVDDLEAPEPAEFQWLLHTVEKLELDEASQTFVSRRDDASMQVHLITPAGLAFSQTDAWPIAPKTGYPTAKKSEPKKLWHFTATTRSQSARRRIGAIMVVSGKAPPAECTVRALSPEMIEVRVKSPDADTLVTIDLSTERAGQDPIIRVRCQPRQGDVETLSVK